MTLIHPPLAVSGRQMLSCCTHFIGEKLRHGWVKWPTACSGVAAADPGGLTGERELFTATVPPRESLCGEVRERESKGPQCAAWGLLRVSFPPHTHTPAGLVALHPSCSPVRPVPCCLSAHLSPPLPGARSAFLYSPLEEMSFVRSSI